MIKKVTYYSVIYRSPDSMNGNKVLGNFANETTAAFFAEGRGPYGRDAAVEEQNIVICDSVEDALEWNKEILRRQALQKLTAEERQALGLT